MIWRMSCKMQWHGGCLVRCRVTWRMSCKMQWHGGCLVRCRVTWRMSCKMQQLLTHQEHLSFFFGAHDAHLLVFSFVCCPIMCLYVLSSVLCDVNYDFRFVFTSCCLYEGLCLNLRYLCLWCPIHYIVFSFDLSSYCFLSTQCCKFL